MTYRVAMIWKHEEGTHQVEREAVRMPEMKEAIVSMVQRNEIPTSATIHVEEEQTRKVIFRNVLSSLSFFN